MVQSFIDRLNKSFSYISNYFKANIKYKSKNIYLFIKKKNFLAFKLNKRFDNNIDCFDIKSNNKLKIFIYLFIIKKTRF